MDTYSNLHPLLEQFEAASFSGIARTISSSSLSGASLHGGVQFISMIRSGNLHPKQRVPVIAAVGINYSQSKNGTTFPNFHRYLTDKSGRPTIEDQAFGMQRALHDTLAAHTRNGPTWVKDNRSPDGFSPGISDGYILVAINFVPFITIKPWLRLPATAQSGLLHLSTGLNFLGPLYTLLSGSVDLWVGHGKTVVWPLFQSWLAIAKPKNWIVTHNLSGLGCTSMANARKNPRNPDHPYFK